MLPISVKNVYELSKDEEMQLQVRWMTLCETLHIPKPAAESIHHQIYYEYRGSHRAYHNLSHIQSLLALLDLYHPKIKEPLEVELAIWFHDFTYEPKRKDNEVQSARWAKELLRPYLPVAMLERVEALILSTEGHQPRLQDSDCLYFLDFDLAILSTPPQVYKQYSEAIAEEYKTWHSFFTYRTGRKAVMTRFLERKRLYFTDDFFNNYEPLARTNIENEIKSRGI